MRHLTLWLSEKVTLLVQLIEIDRKLRLAGVLKRMEPKKLKSVWEFKRRESETWAYRSKKDQQKENP